MRKTDLKFVRGTAAAVCLASALAWGGAQDALGAPNLRFSSSSYSVTEEGGTATITEESYANAYE